MFQILALSDIRLDPKEERIISASVIDAQQRFLIKGKRHLALVVDSDFMRWFRSAMTYEVERADNSDHYKKSDPNDAEYIRQIKETFEQMKKAYDVYGTEP